MTAAQHETGVRRFLGKAERCVEALPERFGERPVRFQPRTEYNRILGASLFLGMHAGRDDDTGRHQYDHAEKADGMREGQEKQRDPRRAFRVQVAKQRIHKAHARKEEPDPAAGQQLLCIDQENHKVNRRDTRGTQKKGGHFAVSVRSNSPTTGTAEKRTASASLGCGALSTESPS